MLPQVHRSCGQRSSAPMPTAGFDPPVDLTPRKATVTFDLPTSRRLQVARVGVAPTVATLEITDENNAVAVDNLLAQERMR